MPPGVTCTTGVALVTRERQPLLPGRTRRLLVHYTGPPQEKHLHFGFSTAGADANTTWWRGDAGWALSSADSLLVGLVNQLIKGLGGLLRPA